MVRPNQIIRADVQAKRFTFIMFAQSERQVQRRVLLLNFPGIILRNGYTTDAVADVTRLSSGLVNRYAVTVDLNLL